MDPITGAIVAALAVGVASGATEVGKKVIVDAYKALKAAIEKKYGDDDKITKAVTDLESEPDFKPNQDSLAGRVEQAKAADDPQLQQLAQALLDALKDISALVPDLLPKEELYTGEWDSALAFQVHYNVLPGSIISRFIVRMHRYVHQNTVWRTGVLLASGENHALVKADYAEDKIYVWVRGPAYGRHELLTRIREQLDAIRDTIQGLQAAEKVPIPGHPELAPVDYRHLRNLERAGIDTWIPEGLTEPLSVRQLLDGVEPQTTRITRDAKYSINVYNGGQVGVIGDEPEVKGGIHFESDKDYHR